MATYKLDRTAFRAQTVGEAADHRSHYQNKTWKARLEIAAYLNSVAHNYDLNNPPRMNRSFFSAKSSKI